jgi:hypothetical protein
VEDLAERVSRSASDTCGFYLTDIVVQLGLRILAPLWEEHPGLKPQAGNANSAPGKLRIPAAELDHVLAALAQLRKAALDAIPIAGAGAATPGESIGYRAALVSVADAVDEATTALRRLEA